MPAGKTKASSGWTELPEAQLLAYPADPSFPLKVRSVIRRIEQQIDYIRGTVSGVSEWQANLTATLPLTLVSNVVALSGLSTVGASNQIVGVNTPGTAWQYWTLQGTADQVDIQYVAGPAIKFSTPQSIAASSSPTFVGLLLTGLTASRLMATDGSKALSSVANLASWIAGTANRVTVADDLDGTVTLSGPQDLHTGASPTFAGLTLSGATASRLLATDGSKALSSVANLASWIAGTANRVTVADDLDGTVTLSGPQDLHTGASPTFAGLSLGSGNLEAQHALLTGSVKVGTTAATATSTTGVMYYDSTHKCEIFSGVDYTVRRRGIIYLQAAQGSVTSTGTPPVKTSLLTLGADEGTTLTTANFFKVGKTIRFVVSGQVSYGWGGETLVLTFESTTHGISSGSAIVTYDLTSSLAAGTSNQPFNIEVILTCRSTGAGGTMVAQNVTKLSTGNGSGSVTTHTMAHSTPTMAWDTTSAETFDFFATWGAPASASNVVKVEHVMMEVLS